MVTKNKKRPGVKADFRSVSNPGSLMLIRSMDARGLSQSDVAKILECSASYINKILLGKKTPSLKMALFIEQNFAIEPKFWGGK